VFLFTESEAARDWAGLIGIVSIIVIFIWEFVRRRRAAAAAAAAESTGETSAAGQP